MGLETVSESVLKDILMCVEHNLDFTIAFNCLVIRQSHFIAALEFSTALAQVDSVQQKLTASLSSSAGMLKQTQNMFDKNAEKVAQNLKEMDERLKKLGK